MAKADRARAAAAIDEFLRALGHEPTADDDLRETGVRVAEAWLEDLLEGERIDVAELLTRESFACGDEASGVVVLRDVEVATMCPHHLMPAMGTALIAYAPGARVAGLGTLTRVLDAYARRMTLQERIGQQVVTALMTHLGASGAACVLRLRHACLSARGPRRAAQIETVASAGVMAPGGAMYGLVSGWMDYAGAR